MKKLAFISVLIVVIGICFTVSAFAEFYVIPVKKSGIKVTSTIVPKTGETTCYSGESPWSAILCTDTGQDGEYQMGITPALAPSDSSPYTVPNWTGDRFTDNNDGTVTDNLTSLIWLKDADSLSGSTNWASALNYCNNLETSGHADWRLPNSNELRSLVDASQGNPCLPSGHPFTNVRSYFYWSSTTCSYNNSGAWNVGMSDGNVNHSLYCDNNNSYFYVWPVRSGN